MYPRLAQSERVRTVRQRHGPLAVSLLVHALTLLAIAVLVHSAAVVEPPAEPSIAMVFVPAPVPVEAPSVPNTSAAAAPTPAEQQPAPTPTEAPSVPNTPLAAAPPPGEQSPPPASVPAPPPKQPVEDGPRLLPPPLVTESPQRQRAPVTRPSPSVAPTVAAAAPSPVATAVAPLLPARPVAGMESDRPPSYPEIARRRGEQGSVLLRVSVSPDGSPLEVTVAKSSGFAALDSAAVSAVERWRFVPATRAGAPIAATAEVPVRFRLVD